MLTNKTILFIAPSFNLYYQNIIDELLFLGAKVDYFSEIKKPTLFGKLYNCNESNESVIINNSSSHYDYLFVIKSEVLSFSFYQTLFKIKVFKKTILYQWDSFRNNPNGLNVIDFFDSVYTFDFNDSVKFDLIYKPLFYNANYKENDKSVVKSQCYDFSFVGTFYESRYYELSKMVKIFDYYNYTYKIKLYFNFFSYIKRFFNEKYIREIPIKMLFFKSMSNKDVSSILRRSNVIIDICHVEQTGLTMRTFEAIGIKKKLLTNNISIVREEFYESGNFFILNENINYNSVLESKYNDFCNEKYFIRNWLLEFFSE
jgi:hypothetical protein